mmetsp:Transcript_7335/g.20332  ORF Transcript_7335/g.20332 Transcript_7335/m.20332 type:complete len:231 (+) Transcript_7335:159-851(+)
MVSTVHDAGHVLQCREGARLMHARSITYRARGSAQKQTAAGHHEHMHMSAEVLQPKLCRKSGLELPPSITGSIWPRASKAAALSLSPSRPYILVKTWNCLRSSGLTLGRTFLRAASKSPGSTSGASSSSGLICMRVISTAPGVPGLQGLQNWRGVPSSAARSTRRKVFAFLQRLTGSYMASRTRMEMSAPLNPSVRSAMRCRSSSRQLCGVLPRERLSSRARASTSGSGM